jgi:hypothetical protein
VLSFLFFQFINIVFGDEYLPFLRIFDVLDRHFSVWTVTYLHLYGSQSAVRAADAWVNL